MGSVRMGDRVQGCNHGIEMGHNSCFNPLQRGKFIVQKLTCFLLRGDVIQDDQLRLSQEDVGIAFQIN